MAQSYEPKSLKVQVFSGTFDQYFEWCRRMNEHERLRQIEEETERPRQLKEIT